MYLHIRNYEGVSANVPSKLKRYRRNMPERPGENTEHCYTPNIANPPESH